MGVYVMLYGFVVEGLHDKDLLEQSFENVKAQHCRGTVLSGREKQGITKLLNECDRVFLLFDPDEQGDRFTKQVQEVFPLPSLRLDPDMCKHHLRNRVKIGVEHASIEYLHAFFFNWGIDLKLKPNVKYDKK